MVKNYHFVSEETVFVKFKSMDDDGYMLWRKSKKTIYADSFRICILQLTTNLQWNVVEISRRLNASVVNLIFQTFKT